MSFIRVDIQRAGANALGILIPPGAKTLVIVRPRALNWDLLPACWDGDSNHAPVFALFTRDEAVSAAKRFIQALELANNLVQTFGDAQSQRLQVWLRTQEFVWIVCRRTPGQAYQPMILTTLEETQREAEKLAAIVCPGSEAPQEYYINTQNFS
jgi:hypothetical protein